MKLKFVESIALLLHLNGRKSILASLNPTYVYHSALCVLLFGWRSGIGCLHQPCRPYPGTDYGLFAVHYQNPDHCLQLLHQQPKPGRPWSLPASLFSIERLYRKPARLSFKNEWTGRNECFSLSPWPHEKIKASYTLAFVLAATAFFYLEIRFDPAKLKGCMTFTPQHSVMGSWFFRSLNKKRNRIHSKRYRSFLESNVRLPCFFVQKSSCFSFPHKQLALQ